MENIFRIWSSYKNVEIDLASFSLITVTTTHASQEKLQLYTSRDRSLLYMDQ